MKRAWPAWLCIFATAVLIFRGASAQTQKASASPNITSAILGKEILDYAVEWKLIRAGSAKITWTPDRSSFRGDLRLESAGLVSKLYRVDDSYSVQLEQQLCASSIFMKSLEGKRQRETKVAFDHARGKASYLERDLLKNSTVLAREIDTPPCVSDILGGLFKMRTLNLEPGQSANIAVSDGKKSVQVRIDAQEREEVKTPTGTYKTIRYEVFVFNNVLYAKQGRAFVWQTDDARKTPVQIRARMNFPIGTITLQLEKEERN
ncbi:MAG TPA: DUF3108 domain-containing protein [Bryobacteraceae bacterium]|nr:DUF3108 domain-containing protein [Bryobacteraceae bacterium]